MSDECFSCPVSESCAMCCENCDAALERLIEDERAEFYKEWFTYVSEYADY